MLEKKKVYVKSNMMSSCGSSKSTASTDWTKCALCQKVTSEKLQCPTKSSRNDSGAGYCTLAENIERFSELNHLPIEIDVARLDEGTGISDKLKQHRAMWHKSCKDKFNSNKIKRAEKRAQSTMSTLPKNTPALVTQTVKYTQNCVFSVIQKPVILCKMLLHFH